MLVVVLKLPFAQITVMVAHALVEQQPRIVRETWWNECYESLMTARVDFSSLVVLIDANARLESLHSQHVGPFYREPQNGNGELLHHFLKDTDLSAAGTFCERSGPTWQSSTGTQQRIDYVLLPCSWMGRLHDAGTHYGVNLQLAERANLASRRLNDTLTRAGRHRYNFCRIDEPMSAVLLRRWTMEQIVPWKGDPTWIPLDMLAECLIARVAIAQFSGTPTSHANRTPTCNSTKHAVAMLVDSLRCLPQSDNLYQMSPVPQSEGPSRNC